MKAVRSFLWTVRCQIAPPGALASSPACSFVAVFGHWVHDLSHPYCLKSDVSTSAVVAFFVSVLAMALCA